jgi:hypothetical protein
MKEIEHHIMEQIQQLDAKAVKGLDPKVGREKKPVQALLVVFLELTKDPTMDVMYAVDLWTAVPPLKTLLRDECALFKALLNTGTDFQRGLRKLARRQLKQGNLQQVRVASIGTSGVWLKGTRMKRRQSWMFRYNSWTRRRLLMLMTEEKVSLTWSSWWRTFHWRNLQRFRKGYGRKGGNGLTHVQGGKEGTTPTCSSHWQNRAFTSGRTYQSKSVIKRGTHDLSPPASNPSRLTKKPSWPPSMLPLMMLSNAPTLFSSIWE